MRQLNNSQCRKHRSMKPIASRALLLISFCSGVQSAKAQSDYVDLAWIEVSHEHSNNIELPSLPYTYEFWVNEGSDAGTLGVTVQPPVPSGVPLLNLSVLFAGWWSVEDVSFVGGFSGPHDFNIQGAGGSLDSMSPTYTLGPSGDFPFVTFPLGGDTGVSLSPMFTWNPIEGWPAGVDIGIEMYDVTADLDLPFTSLPIGSTSWTPPFLLKAGHEYHFEIGVSYETNSTAFTDSGDDYTLRQIYAEVNTIIFTARSFRRVVLGDKPLPLAGALIQIAPAGTSAWQDPSQAGPLLTAEDGSYSLEDVRVPGNYHIRAVALQERPESLGTHQTVINYPAWDPTLVFELGNGSNPEIPLIKYPDPVVFQAGLMAGLSTWDSVMIPILRKDPATDAFKIKNRLPAFFCFPIPSKNPWPVGDGYTGGYDAWFPGGRAHDSNARILADWIRGPIASGFVEPDPSSPVAWVPGATHADLRFDVVCHSMGGLITRALTTSSDAIGGQIRQVVSLDGVHGGTVYPLWRHARGFSEIFLNSSPLHSGWNAGHKEFDTPFLMYSCAATPQLGCLNNFVVLPDKSAFGVGGILTFWQTRFILGPQVAVPESHVAINKSVKRAREVARYFARGFLPFGALVPDATCTSGSNCIPDLGCPEWFLTGPPIGPGDRAGHLQVAAGSVISASISFDSNAAVVCQLMITGTGGSYDFKDNLGGQVPWTLLESQQLSPGTSLDLIEFTAPVVGEVDFELSAMGDDLDVRYNFQFSNGRRLIVTPPIATVSSGSPISITASFLDDQGVLLLGTGGVVTADIDDPAGMITQIQLLDDGASGDGVAGDGVYGGSFGATALEGTYGLFVEGQMILGLETVARSTNTIAAVTATGAFFSGPPSEILVDLDGNQLIDVLELHQHITFTKDGTYRVLGRMETGMGELIAELHMDVEHTSGAGGSDIVLAITAEQLAEAGANGPWILTNRSIVNADADFLVTDSAAPFSTQPYMLAQFDVPPEPDPTALIPSNGPVNGGYSVFLQGTELGNINGVFIDGAPATFVVHTENSAEIVIPPMTPPTGLQPTARVYVDLRITTPWHDQTFKDAFSYGKNLLARKR